MNLALYEARISYNLLFRYLVQDARPIVPLPSEA